MKACNNKEIIIGYHLLDWAIIFSFIKFDDGTKHMQFLCFYIDWK